MLRSIIQLQHLYDNPAASGSLDFGFFAELMDDTSTIVREDSLRPPENTSHSEGVVNFKSERGVETDRHAALFVFGRTPI